MKTLQKGLFLSIEGPDGSGKTTACQTVLEKLKQEGYDVIYTREPGGSNIAEQIRQVILDVNNTEMEVRTEAMLYAASRRQHLVEVVLPALQANKIIVCDRFVDSSLAYQGYARNIGIDEVMSINKFAIGDNFPDLTIYYDISAEKSLARIASRKGLDRLDKESLDFHKKVVEGYQIVCQKYPERIKIVNADQEKEKVAADTYDLIIRKIQEYV